MLIMIEAHTIDSWTLTSERDRASFGYSVILGGFGAPIFLMLAGIAVPLAANRRMRRGASREEAAAAGLRRGWQIFGLAFLFRLQSLVLSGGAAATLLKVDILNIMGLGMAGAAALWGAVRRDVWRAGLLGGAAVAIAMATPVVRAATWLSLLPDPVEWYLRPSPGRTAFTLFPWAAFLLAGGAVGVWLDRARSPRAERLLVLALLAGGPALAMASYAASFLPPIYAQTNFWTSSPTFFFLRLGVLLTLIPTAYWLTRTLPRAGAPLEYFGRASLFVYWIHVEMVYGAMSAALHRRLTFEQALAAFFLFTLLLFGIAKAKDWIVRSRPWDRPLHAIRATIRSPRAGSA